MSFFTLYVSVLGTIFVLNAIVNTLLKCYEISRPLQGQRLEEPNENENNDANGQIPENIHKSMYS